MSSVSMRIQKHVSLDIETAQKAEQMDNFSQYIRDCMNSDLAFKHEAFKRQIQHLLSVIKIARDLGSQSKEFRHAVEQLIL